MTAKKLKDFAKALQGVANAFQASGIGLPVAVTITEPQFENLFNSPGILAFIKDENDQTLFDFSGIQLRVKNL